MVESMQIKIPNMLQRMELLFDVMQCEAWSTFIVQILARIYTISDEQYIHWP